MIPQIRTHSFGAIYYTERIGSCVQCITYVFCANIEHKNYEYVQNNIYMVILSNVTNVKENSVKITREKVNGVTNINSGTFSGCIREGSLQAYMIGPVCFNTN